MNSKTWEMIQDHIRKDAAKRLEWDKEEHKRWIETHNLFAQFLDRGDLKPQKA